MIFELLIELPEYRFNEGVFTLVGPRGEAVLGGPCLGRADGLRAKEANNSPRWADKPYGDTPTGIYQLRRIVHFNPPHARLGAAWLPLEGQFGQALFACTKGGRSGLGVHGGRGEKLVPTYGCIRMRDSDFAAFSQLVATALVRTVIVERRSTP